MKKGEKGISGRVPVTFSLRPKTFSMGLYK